MTLPDGRTVLVYYKNLILDGRMTARRLAALPVTLPDASRAEVFGERFRAASGKQVPARVYNGPSVVHLDGLACVLEASGGVKILEGHHPRRYPTLPDAPDWPRALEFLYTDPITVALVDGGPEHLVELLSEEYPEAASVAADTNQLYYLSDRILADPLVSLHATVRAVEHHVATGRLGPAAAVPAARARAHWESLR
ncbi:hypothetical protein [Streptomyces sp. A0592]|uniref:hypothetical protein n=1 Tax=Streptomyces sp. A0592 TaxID=2563099 RepID=UPI00109EC41F|nr:hypothetical protein [Streptomyces sp. A0592]THA80314.1 hypothetical protein E6U81_29550 [Streptomyces sp. A0592]